MLPGITGIMAGVAAQSATLIHAIRSNETTGGLKVCLDAGDIDSVAAGAQTKWLDVSGNGMDFFRGTDATSQSTDPTFTGAPGAATDGEYWGLDGAGDLFTYDSANETFMNNFHKNNAKFAAASWVYLPASGDFNLMRTYSSPSFPGAVFWWGTNAARFDVVNASASTVFSRAASNGGTRSAWNFLALKVDEAANSCEFVVNGTVSSGTCTYASPSAASAGTTMQLGVGAASRMAGLAVWDTTIPNTNQLTALFDATRGRYGV